MLLDIELGEKAKKCGCTQAEEIGNGVSIMSSGERCGAVVLRNHMTTRD